MEAPLKRIRSILQPKETRTAQSLRRTNDPHRALLHAQLTAHALLLVDAGQIVLHGDGLLGAGLGAFHAADTTGGAVLPGLRALVLVLAQHHRLTLVLRHDADDRVGAGGGTGSAGKLHGSI